MDATTTANEAATAAAAREAGLRATIDSLLAENAKLRSAKTAADAREKIAGYERRERGLVATLRGMSAELADPDAPAPDAVQPVVEAFKLYQSAVSTRVEPIIDNQLRTLTNSLEALAARHPLTA